MGGSGQREAIAANRIKGVRAAVYYDGPIDIIKLSRSLNNANIFNEGYHRPHGYTQEGRQINFGFRKKY